ncbi:Zinc-type alcohol dehydrogenase-like protein [Apiospora rasikravindrae]|uniref:Zinc-type alcohol dehydrogenase-like protein n=1 Tax=Apiospora rasikravindrae TaxID=990691 RepID=A0ABR1S4T1_9PEZI
MAESKDTTAAGGHPKTMRAWTYTAASPNLESCLHLSADAPHPKPQGIPAGSQKDEVLVRVTAAAINPIDYKLPEGLGGLGTRAMFGHPAVPGLDYAGVVVAASAANSSGAGLKEGTPVFGRLEPCRFGTLGEFVVATRAGCAPLPDNVDPLDAACVGTAGLTAYQSLQPYVVPGDSVFINGGSGGTGTWGIQMAKALGCKQVVVSCSAGNADLCRRLGADEVIDYASQNVTEVLKAKGNVFKVVVDNVGSSPADLYKASSAFLVPGGQFVQVGASASLGSAKSLVERMLLPGFLGGGKSKFSLMMAKNDHDALVQIGTWMKEGKVKPVVDQVFPYEEAAKAFEKLKTGRAKGKVVIKHT